MNNFNKLLLITLVLPFSLFSKCLDCEFYDQIINDKYTKYNEIGENFSELPVELIDLKTERERAIFYSGCTFSLQNIMEIRRIQQLD